MYIESKSAPKCWVCGANTLHLVKESAFDKELSSSDFSITDSKYGKTGSIYKCSACGFMQCSEMTEIIQFYEQLEDSEYEETRYPRSKQAEKIINDVKKYRSKGRLLDVGAGSGILVEQAQKMGFDSLGLEPSKWLSKMAVAHGINVKNKVLPIESLSSSMDVVTLIDVIEHVPNPNEIFLQIGEVMRKEAIGVVVTPDCSSLMAKLLGWKWWHYRIAHIGYFNEKTLRISLKSAGLEPIAVKRPTWVFPLDYLIERINVYLPKFFKLPIPNIAKKIIIPLNLRDSLLIYFKKKSV